MLFDDYLKEFYLKTKELKRLSCGMQKSELFAFCALCKQYNISLVLESGIAHGFSTEIIHTVTGLPIIGVDNGYFVENGINPFDQTRIRLSKFKDITLIKGDGSEAIIELVIKHKDKKIAVLIDGPKGYYAAALANKIA